MEGITVSEQELQQRQEVGEVDSQKGTDCPGSEAGRECWKEDVLGPACPCGHLCGVSSASHQGAVCPQETFNNL